MKILIKFDKAFHDKFDPLLVGFDEERAVKF